VSRFQIENNDVGKMLPVLILAAKHKELIALPKTCCVTHSDAWDVAIVVNKIPLAGNEVQAKDVVVHCIDVLIQQHDSYECPYPRP